MSWFPFYSRRIFSLDIGFWTNSSFLSALEKCGFHGFWWHICHLNCFSHLYIKYHFSGADFNINFSLVFRSLTLRYLLISFNGIILMSTKLLESVGYTSFAKFGKFSATISLSTFSTLPSFFLSWKCSDTVLNLFYSPTVPWGSVENFFQSTIFCCV